MRVVFLQEEGGVLVRQREIFIGGGDEGGQQRTAFLVHLDDGLFGFLLQRQFHNAQRHGSIAFFDVVDLVDDGAHLVRYIRLLCQLQQVLHVLGNIRVRLHDVLAFDVHVFRLGKQYQVPGRHGAHVDRVTHAVRRIGTCHDAVDILLKVGVGVGQTPHGQDRDADKEKDQQAEGQSQLLANS